MKEQQPERGPVPNDREFTCKVRFEATIHAGRKARHADWMNYLDVDRVPDPKNQVRALLTADDCVRLLEQGFEIRLHHAHPVRPLDPALIETDESVRRWLDEGLRGIGRPTPPKRSTGPEGT
jgi:hypothetical protein